MPSWPAGPGHALLAGLTALIQAFAVAAGAWAAPAAANPSAGEGSAASGLHRLGDAGGFPPIGMTLDHPQERRSWIFSYRYVRTSSDGLIDGREPVAPESILGAPYSSVPTSQIDQRHVMSVAYAPLDRLTFEFTLPYVLREQHTEQSTGIGTLSSSGIGDALLAFNVPFIENRDQETHLTVGFTFPTGSIQETDGTGSRLPYDLQLGSGTWDIVWGITYTGRIERIAWGGEIHGVYRIGENSVGYRQGTVYAASAWMTAAPFSRVGFSGRIAWEKQGNLKGADPTLDPMASPANDPYRQGSNRLEVGPGVNVHLPYLGGHRFGVEWLFPVFQNASGPQLARDWTLTAGFQWLY